MTEQRTVVGLISDTHGLLRPEAARALSGVDLIVHAGDVGRHEVLRELAAIAPVEAVSAMWTIGTIRCCRGTAACPWVA